jgi:uncharacterized membrane protein YhhN
MKNIWLFLFFIVLAGDLLGVYLDNELLQYIFKPLIVPVVGAYFLSETRRNSNQLKKWVLFALLFSWIGDILLMFDKKTEIYFLAGLGSFLIAHIFYVVFFNRVRINEKVRINYKLLGLVAMYYAGLITLLYGYLGDKRIPVLVYGIVISIMLMLAMHMLFIRNRKAGGPMMTGALLFVISDSILAINKFYSPFEFAGLLIMATYGLAQLFISVGAPRYIRPVKSD